MAGTFSKIIAALSGRSTADKKSGGGKDVKRREQVTDEDLRKKREKERKARARKKRLRDLGITGDEKIKGE